MLGVALQATGFPMAETKQDNAAAYGKIVAKAWRDPAFKAKLLADPQAILKDAGVAVPAGVTVKVVENSASLFHLVLPPKPTGEISDEDLDRVAGGSSGGEHRQTLNQTNATMTEQIRSGQGDLAQAALAIASI